MCLLKIDLFIFLFTVPFPACVLDIAFINCIEKLKVQRQLSALLNRAVLSGLFKNKYILSIYVSKINMSV